MHSPLADERLFWPWAIPSLPHAAAGQTPLYIGAAYLATAALMFAWHGMNSATGMNALQSLEGYDEQSGSD